MARDIVAEIERLTERRHVLWATGVDAEEIKKIAEKLDGLYKEKRVAKASAGSPAQHKRAIKRAIAERELDRLMSTA